LSVLRSALAAAIVCSPAFAAPALATPPEPAKPMSADAYDGRWYEVARLHNLIELNCEAPTFDFSREGGKMSVLETCHEGSATGPRVTHRAGVTILDPGTNAKLRLALLPFVTRDYWVLDHAADNQWAILARTSGNYLWLLARRSDPPKPEIDTMVSRVRSLGYDASKLIYPKQK
jgi:apolipoprotein D and lipocalin family protein